MSKLLYLVSRSGCALPVTAACARAIAERLSPDNFAPAVRVVEGKGILAAIVNPVDVLPVANHSVCLGAFFRHAAQWWQPGHEIPDGSCALFRADESTIELVSDIVGSRTIWYVQADDFLVASTSQRAIVHVLGSYEPNPVAHAWMLSSGTLGPDASWDRRVRKLPPDSRLKVDRRSWTCELTQRPITFAAERLPVRKHAARLRDALDGALAGIDLDAEKWVLPLSGGYDSRALLMMLCRRGRFRTVTWGEPNALDERRSDARVAVEVARYFGVPHEYFVMGSDEPIDRLLGRFLVAGEGATEAISGYMDGFEIWRLLRERGYEGVIRGDESFGWTSSRTPFAVRRSVGLLRLADFESLRDSGVADLYEQPMPDSLLARADESLDAWRDRLYQSYRVSARLAPLNELKSAYVEIVNPLLSRRVVEAARRLPDRLRTDKRLFRTLVEQDGPSIAFATVPAIESPAEIVRRWPVAGLVRSELGSAEAAAVLPARLLALLDDPVRARRRRPARETASRRRFRKLVGRALSRTGLGCARPVLGRGRRGAARLSMDTCRLAFRAYIILRMDRMLRGDSGARNHDSRPSQPVRRTPSTIAPGSDPR